MVKHARIIIIIYLVIIGVGALSATKYYLWSLDYNNQKPWYDTDLEKDPKNFDALKAKALALFEQGDYKNALVYYYKILEIDPYNENAISKRDTILRYMG